MHTSDTPLLAAASQIAREHADEAERLRRLPAVTVAAVQEAGLLTLCLPTAYGGPGRGPVAGRPRPVGPA